MFSSSSNNLIVNNLRCEYHIDPIGLEVAQPRFSWVLESAQRRQKQTAYQILVVGSMEQLKNDHSDLWDTGKVDSAQTNQIAYQGTTLVSRQKCFWKVRTWDKDGNPSKWSETATWSMGLLKSSDWQGKWIGFDTDAMNEDEEIHLPPSPYLRKDFTVKSKIKNATIYTSALGLYELSINGKRVSEDYFTPGWTDYNQRVHYFTYDVTDMLKAGDNTIGSILSNGWYAGYVGFGLMNKLGPDGKGRAFYGKRPAFIAQLEIVYTDGTRQIVATDKEFKASTGAIRKSDILMGEFYDARLEKSGWNKPGFDDSDWKPVTITDVDHKLLRSFPGVPVRKIQEMKPVRITEPKDGVYVFNMGQNFSGRVRLKVKGKAGTKITLRHAEMLHDNGNIMTENLRRARATDTYILKGGGQEIWEPIFTYHGFQYVELTGIEDKPTLDTITGIVLHSDTPVVGSFECSNPMINQLYSNITWTQRSNFFEIPTDCPQRDERLGWTGDAQVYIRAAACNADITAFYTKWLTDLDDAQRPSGVYTDFAPWPYEHGKPYSPAWMDAGVICPYTMYQVYGDKRLLKNLYPGMKKFMDFMLENSTDYIRPADGNSYGDWLALGSQTPKDLIATAYFAYDAKLMAEIAAIIGKSEDVDYYQDLFGKIKTAFNEAYVSEDVIIKGDTQTCYVLALSMDLLPESKTQPAAMRLVELIDKRGGKMGTGFLGTKSILSVLSDQGYMDLAYKLLTTKDFPSWGYSIEQGATTIWERWNSYTKDKGFGDPGMNSFSHYSFGAVCSWMFANIAGIDTDGPGFRNITINPQPGGGIIYAKTSYESINGFIATDWKLDNEKFTLDVTIPANTTATVYIPAKSPDTVTENGKKIDDADGIRFLKTESDKAIYQLGSGSYSFESMTR
ncbi:family 78 glycoside hydrolase catalytic domain [Planctomycetota bacterium]